jgi:hypothetical protein
VREAELNKLTDLLVDVRLNYSLSGLTVLRTYSLNTNVGMYQKTMTHPCHLHHKKKRIAQGDQLVGRASCIVKRFATPYSREIYIRCNYPQTYDSLARSAASSLYEISTCAISTDEEATSAHMNYFSAAVDSFSDSADGAAGAGKTDTECI